MVCLPISERERKKAIFLQSSCTFARRRSGQAIICSNRTVLFLFSLFGHSPSQFFFFQCLFFFFPAPHHLGTDVLSNSQSVTSSAERHSPSTFSISFFLKLLALLYVLLLSITPVEGYKLHVRGIEVRPSSQESFFSSCSPPGEIGSIATEAILGLNEEGGTPEVPSPPAFVLSFACACLCVCVCVHCRSKDGPEATFGPGGGTSPSASADHCQEKQSE